LNSSSKKHLYPGAVSRLAPVIVWMALLLFVSTVRFKVPIQPGFSHSDKLTHFIVYLPLGALLIRAWRKDDSRNGSARSVLLAAFFGAGYGLFIEYIQTMFPERTFEWMDCIADSLGAMMGAAILIYYQGKTRVS
jgi:VanZ family protein